MSSGERGRNLKHPCPSQRPSDRRSVGRAGVECNRQLIAREREVPRDTFTDVAWEQGALKMVGYDPSLLIDRIRPEVCVIPKDRLRGVIRSLDLGSRRAFVRDHFDGASFAGQLGCNVTAPVVDKDAARRCRKTRVAKDFAVDLHRYPGNQPPAADELISRTRAVACVRGCER